MRPNYKETKRSTKRTIKESPRYGKGNWAGFEGRVRVALFDDEGFDGLTRREQAQRWLDTQTSADILIENLLAAEDAISGLALDVEDGDVVDAVKARRHFKDLEDRLHSLAQELSDAIDSL